MASPAEVSGFLDLACNWLPSLAFVMTRAVANGRSGTDDGSSGAG
ncbi:DUF6691 family protein [Caballeronia sp. 15711]